MSKFFFFFKLFEICFFIQKNIHSFKQTVFQASIWVCCFEDTVKNLSLAFRRKAIMSLPPFKNLQQVPITYQIKHKLPSLLFNVLHNMDPILLSKKIIIIIEGLLCYHSTMWGQTGKMLKTWKVSSRILQSNRIINKSCNQLLQHMGNLIVRGENQKNVQQDFRGKELLST